MGRPCVQAPVLSTYPFYLLITFFSFPLISKSGEGTHYTSLFKLHFRPTYLLFFLFSRSYKEVNKNDMTDGCGVKWLGF